MANFKSSEIEAAVSRYVRDTVKTERTDLGPLDSNYTFDEVREFVGSTLVFNPGAVFYLLSLAANRVKQDADLALEYLGDIITGIGEVGRNTTVVTQTGLLEDAAAALLEVERVIEDKNAISLRPFLRYTRALDRFTDKSLTPNVRRLGPGFPDTYEIVRPPQQAQSAIKLNIVELRDLHPTLVDEVKQLTEALGEFLAANLPLLAIQKSVAKVRNDLRSLKSGFDNSTRDGAIEKTRDAFLAIQAGKAVVTNLTSISDPRNSRMASSAASTDRASAVSPCLNATAAQVSAQISAPFLITPSTNELKLEVDGGVEQLVALTPPDPAFILGSIGETFDIHSGNDEIRLVIRDGAVTVTVPLTNGPARTAAQVAADIDAVPFLNASAEAVATASGTINAVKIYPIDYGEESHIKIESQTAVQEEAVKTLGFYEGQEDRGSYFKLSELLAALESLSGLSTEVSFGVPFRGKGGTAVYSGSFYKLRVSAGILDSSVSNKDMLFISNGANVGWYRISSVALLGTYDEITVARPLPAVSGSEAQNQAWEIHRDLVVIKSESTATVSKIKVNSASANSTIGLQEGTSIGSVSGVRVLDVGTPINFLRKDVAVGDRLTLMGPVYSAEHTITDITSDGYQIEVTPEVLNDLASHSYKIESAGAIAYAEFIQELADWFSSELEPSKFEKDIQELERVLNPLLVNKNPSAALVGTADAVAKGLRAVYESLADILASFTAPVAPRIDALLDMLQERGMDRAHELLLLGEFQEFFAANKDSSSYGGNLLEKMRAIAQNDVPLGRGVKHGNVEQRLTGSYEETDADFDFSDQDRETGVTEIDDIPDMDPEEDVLNRSL